MVGQHTRPHVARLTVPPVLETINLASMTASQLQAHSLGSYQVIRKLGSGGMAEVFLAAQHMAGDVERLVVVKAMLPHLADDDRFVQMFLREARIAALLSHPNIVQIYDVSVIEGRPCIVMEFLRGRDLWQVVRRLAKRGERVRPAAAAAIIAQAASGLDYAHRKRDDRGQRLDLVHRDISPHNLFLTREGHVRVLDFGIAKSRYQQQRTQSGVLKGKLPYMAPEQARGKDLDGRTDQFALGVILWEMLTGRRLFAREDPFQTMNSLFHMDVVAPSSIAKDVSPELDAICLRTLSRDREQRYPTCETLANELRDFMHVVTTEREAQIVAATLELAVPIAEDRSFYGFDPESTATSVLLPDGGGVGIHDAETELRDGTPSQSEIKKMAPPIALAETRIGTAQPTITPTISSEDRAPQRPRTFLAVGIAAVLAVTAGISLALVGDGEPSPREAPAGVVALPASLPATERPDPADEGPREIEIHFRDVPDDVQIEVDGAELDGPVLRTLASDRVRHIRALRDGREIWRYDGIFQAPSEVALPELPELAEAESARTERPRVRPTTTRRRPREPDTEPTPMRLRLDNDLDLGYP